MGTPAKVREMVVAWGGWSRRKPKGSFRAGRFMLAKRAMWAMVVWPQTKPSKVSRRNGLKGMPDPSGPPKLKPRWDVHLPKIWNTLSLEQNQLTGNIPVELGRLSNPRYLGLQDNQPTGRIPTELSNTPELKVSTDGLETCPQVEQH